VMGSECTLCKAAGCALQYIWLHGVSHSGLAAQMGSVDDGVRREVAKLLPRS